jgi:hypothetical protein
MTVGPICLDERRFENGDEPMQFTVGFKFEGKVNHVVVDGDDALVAALKLKAQRPAATIMYVRPQNRRGDARHPPLDAFLHSR